jgi:hypothetical protein
VLPALAVKEKSFPVLPVPVLRRALLEQLRERESLSSLLP